MGRKRWHHLHITQYRMLNDWCCLVNEMFSGDAQFGCYLVGGVLADPQYTDVDVRLIMSDEVYAAKYDDKKRKYLNLAVSLWGQKVTGLPIDFQIQPMTLANERYGGGPANTHFATPDGTAVGIASDGGVFLASGWPDPLSKASNLVVTTNATADTGATWTPGTWTSDELRVVYDITATRAILSLGAGQMMALGDNGEAQPASNVSYAAVGRPPTASGTNDLFPSDTANWVGDSDEWGACARWVASGALVAAQEVVFYVLPSAF